MNSVSLNEPLDGKHLSSISTLEKARVPQGLPAAPGLPTFATKTWVYKTFQYSLRFLADVMFDLKVYDMQCIPKTGGVLILSNHQSFIDPVALASKVRRPVSFLAKSELFENRIFGGVIRRLNAFPVRQGEGDVGAIRETIKRLQEGHVLIMFPEGGRSFDSEIQPMQGGVGLVVRRAGPTVRIVPAAVYGAHKAWPRGQKYPRLHTVHAKFGPPMSLADLKPAEIIRKVDEEIRRLYGELKEGMEK